MKVSVLMAVYNTEQYLREALDSLMRQTYRNFEVLCVDDCSTDSSLAILQEYAAKDARFKVLKNTENLGLSKSLNNAVRNATGDIFTNIDSDDWLSDDALEKMVEVFISHPQTDCVLYDLYLTYKDDSQKHFVMPEFEAMNGKDAFLNSFDWTIHGKSAIRGDLNRHLLWDETCRHYSDENTARLLFFKCREVRCCAGKYYYRQHGESIIYKVSISQLDQLRSAESMKRHLREIVCDDEITTRYENICWLMLLKMTIYLRQHKSKFSVDERKEFEREIKHSWENIEYFRLYPKNKYKPGYYPFAGCWTLFKMEYKLFSFLRVLIGRL